MKFNPSIALILLSLIFADVQIGYAQDEAASSEEELISHALLPLPAEYRDGAKVFAYLPDGSVEVVKEGDNGLHCLADKPGDDRFQAVCYHKSLEAFIARGRELRAEGVSGGEVNDMRHQEVDDGVLEKPEQGSMLYNMTMKLEDFDAETAKPALYAIYIPYATEESTGLTTSAPAPGAPWIMRGGTASAHIMVVIP